jgi:hypothetical protein
MISRNRREGTTVSGIAITLSLQEIFRFYGPTSKNRVKDRLFGAGKYSRTNSYAGPTIWLQRPATGMRAPYYRVLIPVFF